MSDEKPITFEAAIRQVVAELAGPTPVTEVARRVLAIRPSRPNSLNKRCATNSAGIGTRPGSTWMPGRSSRCTWFSAAPGSASSCRGWRSSTARCSWNPISVVMPA